MLAGVTAAALAGSAAASAAVMLDASFVRGLADGDYELRVNMVPVKRIGAPIDLADGVRVQHVRDQIAVTLPDRDGRGDVILVGKGDTASLLVNGREPSSGTVIILAGAVAENGSSASGQVQVKSPDGHLLADGSFRLQKPQRRRDPAACEVTRSDCRVGGWSQLVGILRALGQN
jgi:hypothetical protein